MMCHKPVDSLPLNTTIFSGSWKGLVLGVCIIVALVGGATRYQQTPPEPTVVVVIQTPTRTPTSTRTPTLTATPTATPTPSPTPTVTPTPTPAPRIHTVESGDSLLLLAGKYSVTVDEIKALNSVDESTILNVGDTLLIPPAPGEAAPVEPESEFENAPEIVYEVQSGDTLLSIAFAKGSTVDGIIAANPDQDLNIIFPGQEIVIPLWTPTPTSTPTPLPTATFTPGPQYPAPQLLSPADGELIDEETLLLSWTSTVLLADDEFYVVRVEWLNGVTTEHWTQSSSWRVTREERPENGVTRWTVMIMRQTGAKPDGSSSGALLSPAGQTRVFEWR
jgi:LysM repeat protein